MDIRKIKKLIELVEESGITELEVSEEEGTVRISRAAPVVAAPAVQYTAAPTPVAAPAAAPAAAPSAPAAPANNEVSGHAVLSPSVGTFYRRPSPDAKPFIEVGQSVKVGDALCIVEAMKLMNEVKSTVNGKVKKIFVKNGDAIKKGQTIAIIG